jgi:phosphoribosylamine--glycine ligase
VRVLVLGGGGREHALAWKIAQSPTTTGLYCAPGNSGTAAISQNLRLQPADAAEVVAAARGHRIDLVVVGPEAPLVAGVADALAAAGIAVFGPGREAANLEGSKAFAKEVMAAAGVPTAHHRTFDDPKAAEAAAAAGGPIVVKADGLAAGKGVVVARSAEEAVAGVRSLASLGEAARRLVLEELLDGEEVSVIALCDGERYVLLPPARDHKRVGDGDQGPNTGGMGAYAPAGSLPGGLLAEVGRTVIAPTLAELQRRRMPFRGALYAGLMLTAQGPRVLEFNVRFGDPETQPLMMQLEEDILPLLAACAAGRLEPRALAVRGGASVGVVLAAEGYPQSPRTGDVIEGLDAPAGAQIFHAGTSAETGRILTAGGRVLTVCARGATLAEARDLAYAAASRVHFRGMHYRRDIAAR